MNYLNVTVQGYRREREVLIEYINSSSERGSHVKPKTIQENSRRPRINLSSMRQTHVESSCMSDLTAIFHIAPVS